LGPSGAEPSSLRARKAGLLIREARSGTEDLTVRDASGDRVRGLVLDDLSSLGGSGAGADAVGFRGREVKASGAEMAEITPPKAE
jgi:hypothetical protein